MPKILPAMLMLFALTAGGCATLENFYQGLQDKPAPSGSVKPPPPPLPPPPPPVSAKAMKEQLNKAKELIKVGKDDPAREKLLQITGEKGFTDITDEALFRLVLLTMKHENEINGYPQSRQLLERLMRDYPGSLWAVQATPLNDLLVGHWQSELSLGKARRQIKSLKDSNYSLTRENREMRLNIEKLKTLEQELEQKSRR